jgi:hypothetical protein
MEWNISLAIFLATKCVLCLEAIFSVLCLLASSGWRKTIPISVRSTGPRPLVLNCAGLASAAATEPDCWAGDRWVGVVCRPWLNRAGLHLFGVMCCYRAEELWHVSHLVSRGIKWQTCHSPKDVATRLSNREAMSSWAAPSHTRYSGRKTRGWKSS